MAAFCRCLPAGKAYAQGLDLAVDASVAELGGSPDGDGTTVDVAAGPDADSVACAIHRGEIPPSVYRPRMGASGGPPKRLVVFYPPFEANYPTVMKSQIDIAVGALAADKTRSVMLSFGTPVSRTRFHWLGVDQPYADVAAASGTDVGAALAYTRIQIWHAEQLAYLANRLAAIPEGAGTLLDHTLVVWLSETGEASSGNGRDIPVVLLGRAGGAVTTGRYLGAPGYTQADLLSTIASIFGVTGFGDRSLDPRHLPGL